MLMFTAQQFFEVFAAHNVAIWPVQILAEAFGVFAALLLLRSREHVRLPVSTTTPS